MCGRALRLRRLAATTTLGADGADREAPAKPSLASVCIARQGASPAILGIGPPGAFPIVVCMSGKRTGDALAVGRALQHHDAVRARVATLGQSA
jgi:hypothetical protein